jgi:hypothetical protein
MTRPKVTVTRHAGTSTDPHGRTWFTHLVVCHEPGCDYRYEAVVISDATDQAKWHRARHREGRTP